MDEGWVLAVCVTAWMVVMTSVTCSGNERDAARVRCLETVGDVDKCREIFK